MEAETNEYLRQLGDVARTASRRLAVLTGSQKNACLQAMADALHEEGGEVLAANSVDVAEALRAGASQEAVGNLRLTEDRLEDFAKTLQVLVGLGDPIGGVESTWIRPNGLKIERVRIPLGVVGVLYEVCPLVVIEAAGVCLKSGNALIVHGGPAAWRTHVALVELVVSAGVSAGMPEGAVQSTPKPGMDVARALVTRESGLDVVIPRGTDGFRGQMSTCSEVPVLGRSRSVCHMYVDDEADLEMALRIAENAVCSCPSASTAVKTVLLHESVTRAFGPALNEAMHECGMRLHGDERMREAVPGVEPAVEADWRGEHSGRILAVAVVHSLEEAVDHIFRYGTGCSDCIITRDRTAASRFTTSVDSACVYVNASTRFTDGPQFGMGVEIGLSTDRVHARGPIGAQELTTYKYIAVGTGQTRG